ncbi:exopolyphosphatase [Alteromonadaceae bacterium BrNp21-10]|nr:exopolyphosphatase [Alteromonadaceae bacterium BrNp21-10]
MPHLEAAFTEVESREAILVAALDLGSNSFHLVVARIVADSVQILHRIKEKVRLAEGLDNRNVLRDDAMQRGLAILEVMAVSLQGLEPHNVRIVATYTLRKAKNARVFIKAARKILPYPIEIISGMEEARLIYSGVAHTNQDQGQRLVVDIGGGSTEFIIGEGFVPKLLRSLTMGCVSFSSQFFTDGNITQTNFDNAVTLAQQRLELIDAKYRRLGWQYCIGTSGTIRCILEVAKHLSGNDNKTTIDVADLQQIIALTCKAKHIDQLDFAGISEDRRSVFPAGLAILTAAFRSLGIEQMQYSSSALREGVIYEMENRLSDRDIRQRTAESLATRYDVDVEQAKRVLATAMQFYDVCAPEWQLDSQESKALLGWAALLHEVGIQINSSGVQRHSAYILANVDLPGFNQEQQILLSTLVRYQRKKIRIADIPEFELFSSEQVHKLIILLRLSVLLNIKRQGDFLPSIDIVAHQCGLSLVFADQWLQQVPLVSADLQRERDVLQGLELEFA